VYKLFYWHQMVTICCVAIAISSTTIHNISNYKIFSTHNAHIIIS